jgi:hypothetical protein
VTRRLVAAIASLGCVLAAASVDARTRAATSDSTAGMPKARDYSYAYDVLDQSAIRPATRALDLARLARKVAGHPREAANVDANDQVLLPSTWWQPRIGFRPVSVEQMLHGPGSGAGPAPGRWTITKPKAQGVSAGFQIEDANGVKYVIKFDDPRFPGAATAADAIGSRLMWAAGYNVPDNAVAFFRAEDLVIAPGTTFLDTRGHKRPFTQAHLDRMLKTVAPPVDGRYRCLASRFIEGKPLGPFQFEGRRADDPEDLVPHELRRELRGMWTIAAWLNHSDARFANSLDSWVTDHGRTFVRHHLIDFGSIMGSATNVEREYASGFEYYFDYGTVVRQTGTLGLYHARWESIHDPQLPSVGVFESAAFDPGAWRPDYPNPAFDERTVRDVRWGARIVAGFTDAHIRAAVAYGQLPDPGAAEYLARVLIERRDKLVRHWLGESDAGTAGSLTGR